MGLAGNDRNDPIQTCGDVGLATTIVPPRHHGAVALERQGPVIAGSDGDDVRQAHRYVAFAVVIRPPNRNSPVRLEPHHVAAPGAGGDEAYGGVHWRQHL